MEKLKEIPDNFYIGQEFIEDTEFEMSIIEFTFYSPAVLDSFEFYINNRKINGIQDGSLLKISFEEKLSSKLIESLLCGKGEKYIIGYISQYLPRINQEVLSQRYRSAHFLVRTFSTLDIYSLCINIPKHFQEIGLLRIKWPTSIVGFEPVKRLAKNKDHIYLRDFIDAGNDYLVGNCDDCIRKVITSVENAFAFFKLKGIPSKKIPKCISWIFPRETKFHTIIDHNISGSGIAMKTLSNNLIFLYRLRNKIVHDKFRIRHENSWVCKKAIGTLNYLYQFLNQDKETKDYISFLSGQFLMLDSLVKGENLGYIKRSNEVPFDENQIIDSDEKLNNMMFSGLVISEEEKSLILKNKISPYFYA